MAETEYIPVNKQELPIEEKKPSKADNKETVFYQLKRATYEKGDLRVHFPQITEMQSNMKEKQINGIIKEEIFEFVNQYEDDIATLEMDYEVMTETENILSIVYSGYYSGGAYPSHLLFTTNIDMRTGEKIRLPNTITINEEFIDKFNKASYINRDPNSPNVKELSLAVRDYLKQITVEELINGFKQADLPSMTENPYGVYSFFQDDTFIISIRVPHVIGDHAEFKIE
ncbi:DUF4163 domain-containing protein [Niallia sp. XMNu-256]|uniref:PdaC/SigV domain-containing protein n=1 Tax=Niallia sp. XMNu-256 TaxID=3082444 RepID=UPI0030CA5DA4